ncbi:MAG TPA: autotransporter domain-containing protein [Mesorhizobium sp.]|uniref:autotransporter domain-containing protein n=1 Tax=Mesorhizobium sp. TaxID=1871066 RepID=UPI002DDCA25F|nr:autotransporter domain-containing protein [Mesorhizobium sp.]HEV2503261.1 autotransporter domain-containing protein [Mesorhizobium sp.]
MAFAKTLVFIAMLSWFLAPGTHAVAATPQTITFNDPGPQNYGTSPTLSASATSGLPVSLQSTTTNVCTVTNTGVLTFLRAGTCTIDADQAGDPAYDPAPTVQQTFDVNAVVPGAPTAGTFTHVYGSRSATIGFGTPASDGGAAITRYTVTANPGTISATGTTNPITVTGLAYGTTYTFTVTATNSAGEGPASGPMGPITPIGTQMITFDSPGNVNFGTTTTLNATATSGLPVTFNASTANICEIRNGNQVFAKAPGTCVIEASQPGNAAFTPAPPVTMSFNVVIPGGAVSITTSSLPAATGGTFYSQTIVASYGAPPYAFSITANSLPTGLSLNTATGTISGVPRVSGAFGFTIQATDQAGQTASRQFNLTVNAPTITVTPATFPDSQVGTAYSATVSASGGTSPYSYGVTSGSLPVGLVLSPSGVLSGTPTATGSTNFTITATDHLGFSGSQAYSVVIGHAVPVAADKAVSTSYATTTAIDLTASIHGTVTSISMAQPPTRGTFILSGMVVRYTPSAAFFGGTDSFTYTAIGPGGMSAPATVTVTVQPRSPIVFTPGTGALPQATAGAAYTSVITATNGTGPYSYAITGTLPAGLSFDEASGTIGGTPTEIGTTSITVTARDALGFTGTAGYALTVAAPAISAPSLSASVVAGSNTTVDLTAGAAGGPFTDARLIALTPASAGTATIVLGDTADADGAVMASLVAAGRYKLKFTPSPTFSGTAVATYTLSNRYATSAPATISFSVAALPDPTRDSDIAGVANAEAEAAKRFAAMALDNLNSHLEQLHGGGCLANSWGVSLNDSRSGKENRQDAQPSGAADRVGALGLDKDTAGKAPCSPFADGALAFWTGGSVNFGSTDFTDNDRNFDFTTYGLSAGMDYRFSDRFAAGLGISFGSDRSFIGDNGTRTNGLAYSAAVYGSYHPSGGVFLDGVAGYGWLRFGSKRFDAQTGDLFDGSRDGRQIFASVTTGYETTVNGVFISPYLRMSASRSSLDGFSENSAAWSAIRYGDQAIDTFTGLVGLRLGYAMPTDWGVFTPKLRLEYGHDFASASSLALSYANLTGSPSYLLQTAGSARDHATITLGADMQVGQDWTLGADYGFTIDGRSGVGPQQFRLQVGAKF